MSYKIEKKLKQLKEILGSDIAAYIVVTGNAITIHKVASIKISELGDDEEDEDEFEPLSISKDVLKKRLGDGLTYIS